MIALLVSVLSVARLAGAPAPDSTTSTPPAPPAGVSAPAPASPLAPVGPALPVALGLEPSADPVGRAAPPGVGVALPPPRFGRARDGWLLAPRDTTSGTSRRPMAVELPDSYYTRLTIHKIGAIAMFPLFGAEYVLGQKLLNSTNRSSSLKTAHGIVAGAIGVVFATNTITGVWNLWEARHVKQGRARRIVHSVIMLASDAGFMWAAASAGGARRELSRAQNHRNIAIGSMTLSAAGAVMMWLWKD